MSLNNGPFPIIPVVVSVLLAVIPVLIWVRVLFGKSPAQRRSLIFIFIGGTLSVLPIFLLQALWSRFPVLDPFNYISEHIINANQAFIAVFVLVGVMEEIVKNLVVRYWDKWHPELFETIGDALRASIIAALGFAFAENIFYFTNIWVNYTFADLFSAFVFRSVFTAAGHMIFSGIYGYFFGIGKFASDWTAHERWKGKKFFFTKLFTKLSGQKTYEVYRERMILAGLFGAMGLHAVFNFFLQIGNVLLVIFLIAISGTYMYYLMRRKTANLLFSLGQRRQSSMKMDDEAVVIELLGMFFNEGKYEQVIETCNRLLRRDPDNNVVKIFRAKAQDNQKLKGFYGTLKGIFKKTEALENITLVPGAKGIAPAEKEITSAANDAETLPLNPADEKIVAEIMQDWFKEGEYAKAAEVAKRLLARNPNSEGAKLILQKAMDKERLRKVFDSLAVIFSTEEETGNLEA